MEKLSEFGLSERILDDLRRVSRRFPEIEHVLIYGSRARGDFKPYCDIDLAVVAPTLTPQRFTQLWSALEDLPLIFRLDVVHRDRLTNPRLKEAVRRHGRILFSRDCLPYQSWQLLTGLGFQWFSGLSARPDMKRYLRQDA